MPSVLDCTGTDDKGFLGLPDCKAESSVSNLNEFRVKFATLARHLVADRVDTFESSHTSEERALRPCVTVVQTAHFAPLVSNFPARLRSLAVGTA